MKRSELITQLQEVQYNIESVEKSINSKPGVYYTEFGNMHKWHHLIEIRKKALAYWTRRFNRILNELKY